MKMSYSILKKFKTIKSFEKKLSYLFFRQKLIFLFHFQVNCRGHLKILQDGPLQSFYSGTGKEDCGTVFYNKVTDSCLGTISM